MSATQAPVAIIMGSRSDWPVLRHAAEMLESLGVAYEAKVVSAHRTPERMYAFAKVTIERPGVLALPVSALMHLGDNTILQVGQTAFCWVYEDGHANRIEVQTGISDGEWIEVTNRRAPGSAGTLSPVSRRKRGQTDQRSDGDLRRSPDPRIIRTLRIQSAQPFAHL